MSADAASTHIDVDTKALQLAHLALRSHPECFWMRAPEAVLENKADVQLVVRRLRENGGASAWKTAREIEACL